jgi:hypothetical protein
MIRRMNVLLIPSLLGPSVVSHQAALFAAAGTKGGKATAKHSRRYRGD